MRRPCFGPWRPGLLVGTAAFLLSSPAPSRANPKGDDGGERGEGLVFASAINRLAAKQLPVTFQLAGGSEAGAESRPVSIVAVRYCGPFEGGRGRLLALVRRGEAAAQPLLEGARSCKDKPDDVARRAASVAGDGPIALVEILAAPSATRLRFSVGGVATAGEGASALAADLARAKAAGPLATVDTAGLRLATAGGGSLTFDLTVLFPKGGDLVRAAVTPSAGDGPHAAKSSLVDQAAAPAATDAMVGATLELANRILALYTQDDPLVLQVQGDTVEIRALQLSGATGSLTLTGRATSRSLAQSLRVGIDAAGADLEISQVRAEAETEDCSGASFMAAVACRGRNAARAAGAAAFAAGMNAHYRGQPLRALVVPPPFSFEVAGRRLTLRPTLLRASSAAGVVTLYGGLDVD